MYCVTLTPGVLPAEGQPRAVGDAVEVWQIGTALPDHQVRSCIPLHTHSTLTPPSLHPHPTLTTPSLHPYSTLTPPSPHLHPTLTTPSLHPHPMVLVSGVVVCMVHASDVRVMCLSPPVTLESTTLNQRTEYW